MDIKTIKENIVELAMEEMTEDGIHHDDFPDREFEYTDPIVKQLVKDFEVEMNLVEEVPLFKGTNKALDKLTILKK